MGAAVVRTPRLSIPSKTCKDSDGASRCSFEAGLLIKPSCESAHTTCQHRRQRKLHRRAHQGWAGGESGVSTFDVVGALMRDIREGSFDAAPVLVTHRLRYVFGCTRDSPADEMSALRVRVASRHAQGCWRFVGSGSAARTAPRLVKMLLWISNTIAWIHTIASELKRRRKRLQFVLNFPFSFIVAAFGRLGLLYRGGRLTRALGPPRHSTYAHNHSYEPAHGTHACTLCLTPSFALGGRWRRRRLLLRRFRRQEQRQELFALLC